MNSKDNINSNKLNSVICSKCKCTRQARDTIKCLQCKKIFDFNCIGLSEKLYRLMQPEKRKALKCNKCSSNEKVLKTTPRPHNDDKNVTQRKKAVVPSKQAVPTTPRVESPTDKSFSVMDACNVDCDEELDELEESEDTQLDIFSKSEDFSIIKICEIHEMKSEIKELQTSLLSTQNELENTIIENNRYRREINKLEKEIEVLKGICLLYQKKISIIHLLRQKLQRIAACHILLQ